MGSAPARKMQLRVVRYSGSDAGRHDRRRSDVRYNGSYTFAKALYGHITSHISSATSSPRWLGSKSVTKSSCVAPVVMSMSAAARPDRPGKGNGDSLTAGRHRFTDQGHAAGKAVTFDSSERHERDSLDDDQFYQINVPAHRRRRRQHAGRAVEHRSGFRSAFTLQGHNTPEYRRRRLAGPVNGVKANKTSDGVTSAAGGAATPPAVTIRGRSSGQRRNSPTSGSPDGFRVPMPARRLCRSVYVHRRFR